MKDISSGRETEITGVVPYSKLTAYLHRLRIRIDKKEFSVLVLIAESDDVPPILGRVEGIDRFLAEFDKGKELRID